MKRGDKLACCLYAMLQINEFARCCIILNPEIDCWSNDNFIDRASRNWADRASRNYEDRHTDWDNCGGLLIFPGGLLEHDGIASAEELHFSGFLGNFARNLNSLYEERQKSTWNFLVQTNTEIARTLLLASRYEEISPLVMDSAAWTIRLITSLGSDRFLSKWAVGLGVLVWAVQRHEKR